MTSPDPNADTPPSKYNVQIGEGQGIVIGDQAHVVQQFYSTPTEPQVDMAAAEAIYRQKVVDAYKWLDFGGFAYPDLSLANVPLEEVFVRLTLTVEKVIHGPIPPEKSGRAEQRKRQQRERVITVQEPIELDQALGNHLLIVGEPGAGKSILQRWLAVTFAQGCQQEPNRVGPSADSNRLPILVELGHLPDRYLKPEGGETPNWFQILPEYLSGQMAFTNTPPQLLTQALADGRCLLLFDGLDEVADRQARTRLARSLAELVRLSPGNRVIIGSRPAGVSESEGALRPEFQHCQIERFTPEDVQRFFRFWYALDHDLTLEQQRDAADALYARVHTTPATLQLASTPLLSTILVLIWRNEGDLPERRIELYGRCCRVLIERWEASHDVAYQGALVGMDWENHLRLLAPLAYAIHSQEQRTSATGEELLPLLAQALQSAGYTKEPTAAAREAKQFLDTLGLRSGLLQYMGDDRYGFPHLTFQEYLAARYIAAQPDPDYIDLVMTHLHEAWWQQLHMLTITHLESGKEGASKASALILTILNACGCPHWILGRSRNRWLRLIGPGRLLPWAQLERRIAWIQAREFELATRGYIECMLDGTGAKIGTILSAQAASLVRHILYDEDRLEEQKALLTVVCQLSQRQGNEAVVKALLAALHDAHWAVQVQAAVSLVRMGADNEAAVNTLLAMLHDAYWAVQWQAAMALGQVGAGNEVVVKALLAALHDSDRDVQRLAAMALGQVGVGNEAVMKALLAALHDKDVNMQRLAAVALGLVRVGNEVVVNTLLAMLHNKDVNMHRLAAGVLGRVGAGNEAVMKALLTALHGSKEYLQVSAAAVLGQVGAGNEVVVKALLTALHDSDNFVRAHAVASLGQVGAGNEAVMKVLLTALHDAHWAVREQAAASLGQVGAGNEAVVKALLAALHDKDVDVREQAAESLGRLEIKDTFQLRKVLMALNRCLFDSDSSVRQAVLISIRQLLDGRPFPGYRWVPLRKRRAQRLRLKRIAFWLGMTAIIVMIGLVATWLLGALEPNGFPARFLVFLAGIVALVATIAQVLGRMLRDPWGHS